MSIEKVRKFLAKYELDHKIIEFSTSSATVELAAKALNTLPGRIAKTLSFHDQSDGVILIVTAGDCKVDNAKFKATFGLKARMLSPQEVLELTGHAVGGVCPFAIDNPQVKIYADLSLQRFETVFPACGSSNSAIELSPQELEKIVRFEKWIDICKLPPLE